MIDESCECGHRLSVHKLVDDASTQCTFETGQRERCDCAEFKPHAIGTCFKHKKYACSDCTKEALHAAKKQVAVARAMGDVAVSLANLQTIVSATGEVQTGTVMQPNREDPPMTWACPTCKSYHVGACPRLGDKGIAPKPVSKRVLCRLCSCEGVQGTLLCQEHLAGVQFAHAWLLQEGRSVLADRLLNVIQQQKGEDNDE